MWSVLPHQPQAVSSYGSFPPHHWLAVTGDGVSFMALERRDVIAAAAVHLDVLDANPDESHPHQSPAICRCVGERRGILPLHRAAELTDNPVVTEKGV